MLNIAVCDDEPHILEELCSLAAGFMKKERVISGFKLFTSPNELLSCPESFDIIFLDILMNGLSGIETARELRRRRFKGYLIFVTSAEEYVFDSFEVSPYDYLVKPVTEEKMNKTLSRLLSAAKDRPSGDIMIKSGSESRIVPLENIVHFEVKDKKIYLHTLHGETVDFYGKMESLEEKLSEDFFKCHRSYIVNLRLIKSFGKDGVKTGTGETLPVSRLRLADLEKAAADCISKNGGIF